MRGIVNEQLTLTACEIGFTSATKKSEFTTAVSGCCGDVYLQSRQYPRNDTALKSRVLSKNWAQMKLASFSGSK